MIDVQDKAQCAGCSACMAVCPQDAIVMGPDALGFLYPEVNASKCVDCGLCEKVCPFSADWVKKSGAYAQNAFAVRHKDMKEVETSRSGAAFIALSDWILRQGGTVYGAGFSHDFTVTHKRADTRVARDEFKGSKYAQSDMTGIFRMVKADLQSGLSVLFSGTPCQTAGLKSYIGEKLSSRLYLVDIVCHGVASPSVWRDYVSYLKQREKDDIVTVNFRDKSLFGWSGLHKESFLFSKRGLKTYDYTFYQPYMLRESCSKCHFANLNRPSDVTIGDFWGWQRVLAWPDDDKGISLVLCNTDKGYSLLQASAGDLRLEQVAIKDCLQPNLQQPTPMDSRHSDFARDYAEYGFGHVMKKYGEVGLPFKVRRIMKFIKRKLGCGRRK